MKTNNSREPPFRFEAHGLQNMAGAISVDQFSPVFQRFDFRFDSKIRLCSTVIQTVCRTSVCRRITPFLDQWINAKFAKSMSASACLLTGQKCRQSFSHNNTQPSTLSSWSHWPRGPVYSKSYCPPPKSTGSQFFQTT